MGSCQNYGSFLGTLNIRCRIEIRTQKGTIILTTTHMKFLTCDVTDATAMQGALQGSLGFDHGPDSNKDFCCFCCMPRVVDPSITLNPKP